MANREDNPRFKIIFAMFARRKEGFPSGGSWRRRRLMRGDKTEPMGRYFFTRAGTTHGSFRPDHQLTFCRFYPVAERGDSRPHFADGMRLGAAGIRSA